MKFLVTANDTGAVKEVEVGRGADTSVKDALQPTSVKNFWAGKGSAARLLFLEEFDGSIFVGIRRNGLLSIYDNNDNGADDKYAQLHEYVLDIETGDLPVALVCLEHMDGVVVAYESRKAFFVCFNSSKFDLEPVLVELPGKQTISAFECNPYDDGVFAYGGKDLDVQIVRIYKENDTIELIKDLTTPESLFCAKNVPLDHLQMRVPIWVSQIKFFNSESTAGKYNFVTATRYGQIRLYNTAESDLPTKDYKVCEKPIMNMAFANQKETEVVITDTHNLIAKYSLVDEIKNGYKVHSASAGDIIKPLCKLLGKYSAGGNTGATRALRVFNNEILVAAGLDRYLRVFDVATRAILAKVYLGVEVSAVVCLDIEDELPQTHDNKTLTLQPKKRRDIQQAEESDEEELWSKLDAAPLKKKKATK